MLRTSLPVVAMELYNGRREGDPTWQKCDMARAEAEALKERVVAYLQAAAAEKGFALRTAGVIDLGEIRQLRAIWKSDPALQTGGVTDACAQ